MHATIQGWDIVCPSPIRTAPSRYARRRLSAGRNSSRGISAIAASTRSSWIPRRRSWRSTIRSRSVDVVPESRGVMHGHLPTSKRDDSGALERREEAAAALPGRARQVGDLGLGRADQDVGVRRPVGLARDRLGQDRKSTRLNSSHTVISYAVFCLKKKKK